MVLLVTGLSLCAWRNSNEKIIIMRTFHLKTLSHCLWILTAFSLFLTVSTFAQTTLIDSSIVKSGKEKFHFGAHTYSIQLLDGVNVYDATYVNVKNKLYKTAQTFPDVSDLPKTMTEERTFFIDYEQDYLKLNYPEIIQCITQVISLDKLTQLSSPESRSIISIYAYIDPKGFVKELRFGLDTRKREHTKLLIQDVAALEKAILDLKLIAYVPKGLAKNHVLGRKGWNYYIRTQGISVAQILECKRTGVVPKKFTGSFGLKSYVTLNDFLKR